MSEEELRYGSPRMGGNYIQYRQKTDDNVVETLSTIHTYRTSAYALTADVRIRGVYFALVEELPINACTVTLVNNDKEIYTGEARQGKLEGLDIAAKQGTLRIVFKPKRSFGLWSWAGDSKHKGEVTTREGTKQGKEYGVWFSYDFEKQHAPATIRTDEYGFTILPTDARVHRYGLMIEDDLTYDDSTGDYGTSPVAEVPYYMVNPSYTHLPTSTHMRVIPFTERNDVRYMYKPVQLQASTDTPIWYTSVAPSGLRMGAYYASTSRPYLSGAAFLYERFSWKELEPSRGKFDFRVIDALIAEATRQGRRVIFRVRSLIRNKGKAVPDWFNFGTWRTVKGETNKDFIPDWNHPEYIAGIRRLNKALADRYDKNPTVAAFENGYFGTWGEWHSWGYESFGPLLTTPTMQALVDMQHDWKDTHKIYLAGNEQAITYVLDTVDNVWLRGDSWTTDELDRTFFYKHTSEIRDRIFEKPKIVEPYNPPDLTTGGLQLAQRQATVHNISYISDLNIPRNSSITVQRELQRIRFGTLMDMISCAAVGTSLELVFRITGAIPIENVPIQLIGQKKDGTSISVSLPIPLYGRKEGSWIYQQDVPELDTCVAFRIEIGGSDMAFGKRASVDQLNLEDKVRLLEDAVETYKEQISQIEELAIKLTEALRPTPLIVEN